VDTSGACRGACTRGRKRTSTTQSPSLERTVGNCVSPFNRLAMPRGATESNCRDEATSLKHQVIGSQKKPGKPAFFYLKHVTECYCLSPDTGTFLEDFFERSNTAPWAVGFSISARVGASTRVSLRATPSIFHVNESMRVYERFSLKVFARVFNSFWCVLLPSPSFPLFSAVARVYIVSFRSLDNRQHMEVHRSR
jgi:hypothetical protein